MVEGDEAVVEVVADGVGTHANEGSQAVGTHHKTTRKLPLGLAHHPCQSPRQRKLHGITQTEAYQEAQGLTVETPAVRMEDPEFVPKKRIDHSGHVAAGICHPRIDAEARFQPYDHYESEGGVAASDKQIFAELSGIGPMQMRSLHLVRSFISGRCHP